MAPQPVTSSDGRTLIVHTPLLTSALLAAHTTSVGQYWHKITDPTFKGIYHVNAFDLAMMIPYFLVLFVLATYGLHRYWLVYYFFNNTPNNPRPPSEGQHFPPGA